LDVKHQVTYLLLLFFAVIVIVVVVVVVVVAAAAAALVVACLFACSFVSLFVCLEIINMEQQIRFDYSRYLGITMQRNWKERILKALTVSRLAL